MNLSPRWRKVFKDLWGNKVRTLLVVASIAIGVFAIGMIVGTRNMLGNDLAEGYQATSPASVMIYTTPFEEDLVHSVRRMRAVGEAEARRGETLRVQLPSAEIRNLDLGVVADYDEMHLNQIASVSGEWPPSRNSILMEQSSMAMLGLQMGDVVSAERADGKWRDLTITGVVHDMNRESAQFSGTVVAFTNMATMERLGYGSGYNQLHVRVAENQLDKGHIEQVTKAVEEKITKDGVYVFGSWVPDPGKHPAQEVVDPMLIILGVLGALSLFASCFLVVNIINGLLSQQTQQIGVMKALGARRGQIVQMYLVAVMALGLVALLVAVPLGGVAAYLFTGYIANLVNFELAGFRIPTQAIGVMVLVGILVPLLAAIVPVVNGSRITVREAISDYGLGKGQFGGSALDRGVNWLSGQVLGLSRPMRISLRNSIRRKGRLLLTLITLTLGGAIFVGILSVHQSLLATLDDTLDYFAYDVELEFDRAYRSEEIQRDLALVEGVEVGESWLGSSVTRVRADDTRSNGLIVLGTQSDTRLINPQLVEGRWISAEDQNAIVVNTDILKEEPDIQLGDTIMLDMDGREDPWVVVGVVKGLLTGPIAYVNLPYLERELGTVGRFGSVQIIAENHDVAAQKELADRLRTHFETAGYQVSGTETIGELRESIEYQFNLLVVFLAVMALLIAIVGGLGLTGTMSINVLERTREIGVMRALGASDGAVLRIVLVEGLFVGAISWLLGTGFAIPIGRVLSQVVGTTFLESPLAYRFDTLGALGWLVAVLVIAALASVLPALKAARLSVRQTLSYE